MHNLFVVVGFAKAAGFNKLAEVIGLGQFVDERYAFCCVFVGAEFVEVEEVSCICMVWDFSIFVKSWIF